MSKIYYRAEDGTYKPLYVKGLWRPMTNKQC